MKPPRGASGTAAQRDTRRWVGYLRLSACRARGTRVRCGALVWREGVTLPLNRFAMFRPPRARGHTPAGGLHPNTADAVQCIAERPEIQQQRMCPNHVIEFAAPQYYDLFYKIKLGYLCSCSAALG